MSDYPQQPQYGASYGGQANPYPPPPVYPAQYMQQQNDTRGVENQYMSQYNQNMAAYGYNAAAAPGFNTASLAAASTPLPIYQGWNQDSTPLPAYHPPQNNIPHNVYNAQSYNNNNSYTPQYQAPPQPQQSYQQNASSQAVKPYNNGEVAEASYEDGYAAPGTSSTPYQGNSVAYPPNDRNGYTDTAHRAVYTRAQDPVLPPRPESGFARETHSKRQKSGSYSPFEDRPIPHNSYALDQVAKNTSHGQKKKQPSSLVESKPVSSTQAKQSPVPKPQEISAKVTTPVKTTTVASNGENSKSLIEQRKNAQTAILNLYPLQIRYSTFMDEGFSKDIVGSLYDGLRLRREVTPVSGDNSPPKIPDALPTLDVSGQKKGVASLPAKLAIPSLGKIGGIQSPSGTLTSPSTVTKPAQVTDKDRTLQLKMEALRKSREERAKKAAAEKSSSKAIPVVPTPVPAAAKQVSEPVSMAETSALNTAVVPVGNSPSAVVQKSPAPSTNKSSLPTNTQLPPKPVQTELKIVTTVPQSPAPALAGQQIPGLFLGSSTQRKRPVAADFDTAAPTQFKRPFGHSRGGDTPVVIDVSEEESEDEDVEMDLDSGADQDSPLQAPIRRFSDQRTNSFPNMPQLTNALPRKPFTPTPASSAASTPPAFPPTRKPTLVGPEGLRAKEMQIEEMRRKIAEAEAAKAQKKAQQSTNISRLPRPTSVDADKQNDVETTNKVQASTQIQEMIEAAQEQVNSDQERLVEAQAIEEEKSAELKAKETESKQLRLDKMNADQSRVDADVAEKQRKLQELREQMAQIEADVQKGLEEKKRMAEEMVRLSREADEQLQAQKKKLEELKTIEVPAPIPDKALMSENRSETPRAVDSSPKTLQPSLTPFSPSRNALASNEKAAMPVEPSLLTGTDSSAIISNLKPDSPKSRELTLTTEDKKEIATADQALEAALQESARAEIDSSHEQHDDDEIDIEEDFYAVDPVQPEMPLKDSQVEGKNRSPSYSPGLENDELAALEDQESGGEYEPPEAASPAALPAANSSPFSPEPPRVSEPDIEVLPDTESVVAAEADSDVSMVIDEGEVSDTPLNMDEGESSSVHETNIENSLPHENGSVSQLTENRMTDHHDESIHFTAYESPLKYFHAFRFHPDFDKQVPGGLRSLTYSHKIDVNKEFCPWELGGACNDRDCEFQHFRDIGLLDDGILSALGNPAEFKGEQRNRFCNGLKTVLTGLRARKIRDFDIIAKEVIAHRAQFLGDSSKVLRLD